MERRGEISIMPHQSMWKVRHIPSQIYLLPALQSSNALLFFIIPSNERLIAALGDVGRTVYSTAQ